MSGKKKKNTRIFPKCSCLKGCVSICGSVRKDLSNHDTQSLLASISNPSRVHMQEFILLRKIRGVSLFFGTKKKYGFVTFSFSFFKIKSFSSVLNKPEEILRQTFCIITFPWVVCMIVFTKAPFSPS